MIVIDLSMVFICFLHGMVFIAVSMAFIDVQWFTMVFIKICLSPSILWWISSRVFTRVFTVFMDVFLLLHSFRWCFIEFCSALSTFQWYSLICSICSPMFTWCSSISSRCRGVHQIVQGLHRFGSSFHWFVQYVSPLFPWLSFILDRVQWFLHDVHRVLQGLH